MTAAMLARRQEIAYFNSDEARLKREGNRYKSDGLTDDAFENFQRRMMKTSINGDEIGTELGAAAIERMSSDARAVGSEVGSVVQEAMKAIAPQIGAAIAQAFAAGASQVKVGVNMAGGPSGKINADTGRTMPASVGRPVSTGG